MEPATAFGPTASCDGYYCGRCGQPKKDHVCHISSGPAACESLVDNAPSPALFSVTRPLPPPPHRPFSHLRPALSLNDNDIGYGPPDPYVDSESGSGSGGLPSSCLWEILKRLPPPELLAAAPVCKRWRDTTRRLWKAAEVLRIKVPARAQIGLLGSVLQKYPRLVNLSLRMESDVDATLLSWIKSSCPNLESLQISTSETTTNWITGDELGQFVADRRLLKSLKMEGCSNLGGVSLCSSSLCTIWLSGLHSITKMVFNCPNLTEITVDFPGQKNDNTDLVAIVNILGRNCPGLQNLRIASIRLSNAVVHALAAAHLRGLRMLSLVLGSEITDASVDAITSSYPNLELLDLSGSSISDRGIQMICNVFPDTLSRLLVALCPNISSSIIQFATAQLPLLQLLDCGMTLCDPNSTDSNSDVTSGRVSPQTSNIKVPMGYQKLTIKHGRLKKLSLWGCSSLDTLYLNCPELNDLNLNSCRNLHPERLALQCPNLEKVHAFGCQRLLIGAIESQVDASVAAMTSSYPNFELLDLSGVRVFMVRTAKNDMKLLEYMPENIYSATGSGDSYVESYFERRSKPELDRLAAHSMIRGAMLQAALSDASTGGNIEIFEVTPLHIEQFPEESVINLYSQHLLEIESAAKGLLLVHNKTIHKVSNKILAAKFASLSGTGSVYVSHVLAEIGDYNLRRLVFKNPADSERAYKKLNKDFPWNNIKDTERAQIETHKNIVHCGKEKKKKVMNDIFAGLATVGLLEELLRVLEG